MDVTLKFAVTVGGREHEVQVRAKLVIGSHLMDREVEAYSARMSRRTSCNEWSWGTLSLS